MSRVARASIMVLGLVALVGCKNRHSRIDDTLTCTPGESLTIGCTGTVGSVCDGDPVMNVCDGTVTPDACTDATASAHVDDFGGTPCPQVTTTCGASGRVTISVHGASGASYGCYWDVSHGGIVPSDAGPGAGG